MHNMIKHALKSQIESSKTTPNEASICVCVCVYYIQTLRYSKPHRIFG